METIAEIERQIANARRRNAIDGGRFVLKILIPKLEHECPDSVPALLDMARALQKLENLPENAPGNSDAS